MDHDHKDLSLISGVPERTRSTHRSFCKLNPKTYRIQNKTLWKSSMSTLDKKAVNFTILN